NQQFFVEVKDMAMRVTFAENGDKTKDIRLHAKASTIGRNQTFTRDLGGAIETGLDGKRTGLRRRKDIRLAVHGARRGKRQPPYVIGPHRLEYIEGRHGILFQVFTRMLRAKTHVGIGGQMEDNVSTVHGLGQALHIEQIASLQAKLHKLLRRPEK